MITVIMKKNYYKKDGILTKKSLEGIILLDIERNVKREIPNIYVDNWINWEWTLSDTAQINFLEKLANEGFVENKKHQTKNDEFELENTFVAIAGKDIKWNEETADLYYVMNAAQSVSRSEPIVLGPYGSLCWRMIVEGRMLDEIMREAKRVFGYSNCVISFLKYMVKEGYLKSISLPKCEFEPPVMFSQVELYTHVPHFVRPWYCAWEITKSCDLRCKHCFIDDFNKNELTEERAIELAKKIIDAKIFHVILMGGEPLLRKDLEKVISFFRENGVYVSIITNGQTLSYDRAKSLADVGLSMIYVSIDGFHQDIHEKIRGKGTFEKSIAAIKNAKRAGIPRVAISCAINDLNFKEYFDIPKFTSDLDIHEVYLELFKKTGFLGKAAEFNPVGIDEVRTIKQSIDKWQEEYPELYISFATRCLCGRSRARVDEKGNVSICSFENKVYGNLWDNNFGEIWDAVESEIPLLGPAGYCKCDRLLYLLNLLG